MKENFRKKQANWILSSRNEAEVGMRMGVGGMETTEIE
jgi:hypothetical protein